MRPMTKKLNSIVLSLLLLIAVGLGIRVFAMPSEYRALAEGSVNLLLATENPSDYELTLGADYDIGATVIDEEGTLIAPIVSVVIAEENGNVEYSLSEVPESYIYHFKNTGVYTLSYALIDDDETVYTEVISVNVKRTYYRLHNIAERNVVSYGDDDAVVVSQNCIYIFDSAYGANFYDVTASNLSVTMKVKMPGENDYVELTHKEKTQGYVFEKVFGEYVFSYEASYEVDGETYSISGVSFTVELVDGTHPTLYLVGEDDYLNNAIYESTSIDGKTTYYKGIVNQTLTFGKLLARDDVGTKTDLTSDIGWSVYCDGQTKIAFTICGDTQELSYKPDTCGRYIFAFSVADDFGNKDYHYLVVDVREYLYELTIDFGLKTTYTTEEKLIFNGFKVTNHLGASVSDIVKQIVISKDEETLTVLSEGQGDFIFETSGQYKVVYQVLKNGESVCEKSSLIDVEDKTAPRIVLSGKVGKSGVVGDLIMLPTIECEDNETRTTYDISIVLGERQINHYKGSFRPAEAGTYIVTIVASDLNGNSTTYSYDVTVVDGLNNGCASTLGTMNIVAMVLSCVLVVVILKKKNLKNGE